VSQPRTARTLTGYISFFPTPAYETLAVDDFGDVPLTVILSGNTRNPEDDETEEDVAAWHEEFSQYLADLAARSTRGRGPVVVDSATHTSITLDPDYADQVVREILEVESEAVTGSKGGGRGPQGAGWDRASATPTQRHGVRWKVFDAGLDPRGTVYLSRSLDVKFVSRRAVFGVELDAMDVPSIVRYDIGR
jgi:hypothetical protein